MFLSHICKVVFILSVFVSGVYAGQEIASIVRPENRISDFEARFYLAQVLSYQKDSLKESLNEFLKLLEENPYSLTVRFETARVCNMLEMYEEALVHLKMIMQQEPIAAEVLAEAAFSEAMLGHAQNSRQLFLSLLQKEKPSDESLIRFADSMLTWGDFYRAETIYMEYLNDNPDSTETILKLASVYVSSERYEEAEEIYRKILLTNPDCADTIYLLAELKFSEKNFSETVNLCKTMLEINPLDRDAILLKAEALAYLEDYPESLKLYGMLYDTPEALLGKAKIHLKLNKPETASGFFNKALEIDPEHLETLFSLCIEGETGSCAFLLTLNNPSDIRQVAEMYASRGATAEAVAWYKKALDIDPDYFPARLGIAEALAAARRYREALQKYSALLNDLPGTSKLMIAMARVNGWAKDYDTSMQIYDTITDLNPKDPVPRKEKARVALWAKEAPLAWDTYGSLIAASIDEKVEPVLGDEIVRDTGKAPAGFELYESLLQTEQQRPVLEILYSHYAYYRIYKSVWLEKRAKRLNWDRRYTAALDSYKKLIDFNPGNLEAIFDYAQINCNLGLCDKTVASYRQILQIDPLHNLASIALEKELIKSNPYMETLYSYWREDGRGELSRITRQKTDIVIGIPLSCRYWLRIKENHWFERTDFNRKHYHARGNSIEFDAVLSSSTRLSFGWTYKRYDARAHSTEHFGFFTLHKKITDRFKLSMGYERTDELYNYFGLKQGLTADTGWLGAEVDITRNFNIKSFIKNLYYSDSNRLFQYNFSAGYAFTEHPRIFKIAVNGEYRDTEKKNRYFYRNGLLANIVHPYWTPQSYGAGSVTFEWYHDYSKLFFCGNDLRFYDIKVTAGSDSEDNPSVTLEAGIHHEFMKRWTVEAKGLFHRSRKWDAEGAWFFIKYSF